MPGGIYVVLLTRYVSELNQHAEEMPSNPVANTPIAVATRYVTMRESV